MDDDTKPDGKPAPPAHLWQKGQSGNPGGRRADAGPIRALARQYSEQAIQALVAALSDENVRARIAAAEILLDRGYGRPVTPVEVEAGDSLVERLHEAVARMYGADAIRH